MGRIDCGVGRPCEFIGLPASDAGRAQDPLEGQQAAKALSQAYEAVAEFARPSVVQIMVQKKVAGMPNMPGLPRSSSSRRAVTRTSNPRDFEEMLRRFFGPNGRPRRKSNSAPARHAGSARDSCTTTAAIS